MKVLFLSQWYPHRYDQMAGLFVKKHAEAVALYCDVKVLYIHADENIDHFETEEKSHSGIDELIVYFPNKRGKALYSIRKSINYLRAYYIGLKHFKQTGFNPDIVHANILTRTGLIALFLKFWKGTPYVITEHWSRYLPERNAFNGIIRKCITRCVIRKAEAVLPVSNSLKKAMIAHRLVNKNYVVVNNVVDDYFFQTQKLIPHTKKRILHVSCFDEQAKNIKGILRAIEQLNKIRQDFELIIIGTGIDFNEVVEYSKTLNINNTVIFQGEKTPPEVAIWMQNSDFFVLFSNYETAAVVIAESLVLGKPVISSNVGIAEEYINDTNGIIINTQDEDALVDKMNFMLDHFHDYNSQKIRTDFAEKFSYKTIGKKIAAVYEEATKAH